MTSSQNDPRIGQDDSIGGAARTTSTDVIGLIYAFNEQFIKLPTMPLNPLTPDQYNWIKAFIAEETAEFSTAYDRQDIVGMVDGVIDLIYGALGTLKKMGVTPEQALACFMAVHNANMTKKKGVTHRGHEEDATKPAEFVAPDQVIGTILFGD
jgi:phosphoribosyl-ATP pyrophosphohydrolase